jgi:VWFA-related protein
MRSKLAILVAVSLLAWPLPVQHAQEAAATTPSSSSSQGEQLATGLMGTVRSTVDLVLIDVRVTDRAGKPIPGLKPTQFTLSEDNKSQRIASFDYHDIESIETATAGGPPIVVPLGGVTPPETLKQAVRDHRLIVLFFDTTAMQPDELLRSQDAADQYLKKQISPADLVAVVVFGNQLSVPVPFTNDRERLLRGVQALRPGKEAQLATVAEAAAQPGEDSLSEDTGAAFTPDETEFNIFNSDRKLAALESLADLLRVIPGKKSVVQFTGGITQTGEENRSQVRAATDAANRANVSFYTVDSRGLFPQVPGGEARLGASAGSAQFTGTGKGTEAHASSRAMFTGAAVFNQVTTRHASRETLATLAIDTGGRAFFDLGDFREVFRRVQEDNSGYYLLGYYSTNKQRDGRWRRVQVRVDVPGARIRYRDGYYAPKDYGPVTPQERERQLIEAMRAEAPRVDFPVALITASFRLNHKEIFVPIAAKLASNELQWARKHGRHQAVFDFATEVREEQSNRVAAALRDTITVSLDKERFNQLQQRNLVYQGGVILPPGNYRLKFIAQEEETGRISTFEEKVVLKPLQPDRLELSSVLLSSQLEPVRHSAEVKKETLGTRAQLKMTPLEVSGERIIPSVTRVFTTEQDLYVFFQAYLPTKVDDSSLRAGLVFFRNGEWSSETPLVEPAEVNTTTHSATFRMHLPLGKLASGAYTVQAVVVEQGSGDSAFAQNYFALRSAPRQVTSPH